MNEGKRRNVVTEVRQTITHDDGKPFCTIESRVTHHDVPANHLPQIEQVAKQTVNTMADGFLQMGQSVR